MLVDSNLTINNVGQGITIGGGTIVEFRGVTLTGAAVPTSLIESLTTKGGFVSFDDCDFSAIVTGKAIVGNLPTSDGDGQLTLVGSNIQIGTGGSVNTATFVDSKSRIELRNIDDSNTVHHFHVEDIWGTSLEDSSIYGDATVDGSTSYSLHVTTTADATEFYHPHRVLLAEFSSDANPTLTAHVNHDSATNVQNDEVWVEVIYPDATTGALGKRADTRAADPLATPADLSSSALSWTGTGGWSNENKQQMAHTVSGGGAGMHQVWLCVAKPGPYDIYADPLVVIT